LENESSYPIYNRVLKISFNIISTLRYHQREYTTGEKKNAIGLERVIIRIGII